MTRILYVEASRMFYRPIPIAREFEWKIIAIIRIAACSFSKQSHFFG